MSTERLGQSDFEDLSAFIDGELPADRSRRIARLVVEDAAWREAHERLGAIDEMLNAYQAPPARDDLPERIRLAVHRAGYRPPAWVRVIRLAAPLAAAAAVLLAVVLTQVPTTSRPTDGKVAGVTSSMKIPAGKLQAADTLAADNLDFFRDYDVVNDFDTLEALDRIEKNGIQ